jgi:hypothetical protein
VRRRRHIPRDPAADAFGAGCVFGVLLGVLLMLGLEAVVACSW